MDPKNQSTEQLDSISKRLKFLVDTLGVKQSHMAKKLGLSPSGLHYILNNDVKFSKNAKKVADYLNVNEQWLVEGKGGVYDEASESTPYKVPIYHSKPLKQYYCAPNSAMPPAPASFFYTTTKYFNSLIGIIVTEPDFAPKFEPNDWLIFEKTPDVTDGEIVLAYLHEPDALVIRQAIRVLNELILISPNVSSPTKLNFQQGDSLIGGYRECLKKR